MKMLFFSADRTEVDLVRKAFTEAGIVCEERESGITRALFPNPGEAELWIQHDEDTYKALLLCVERGIGFAKRSTTPDSPFLYPSWEVENTPESEEKREPERSSSDRRRT